MLILDCMTIGESRVSNRQLRFPILEIPVGEACVFGDAREHARANLLAVVESPSVFAAHRVDKLNVR